MEKSDKYCYKSLDCVILFFVDVCGYIGHHIKELKANGRIKEGVER